MENLVDTKRAAELLGLRESTVRKYTCLRLIPFLKLNAAVRFRPSELESWVEAHRVPAIDKHTAEPISGDPSARRGRPRKAEAGAGGAA
jgi:hypothetical protein